MLLKVCSSLTIKLSFFGLDSRTLISRGYGGHRRWLMTIEYNWEELDSVDNKLRPVLVVCKDGKTLTFLVDGVSYCCDPSKPLGPFENALVIRISTGMWAWKELAGEFLWVWSKD